MKKPNRIKAALLDWLGIPISLTDSGFWSQVGTTAAGQQINDTTILKLSTVWACSRLVAETIATLPLGLFEKTSKGRQSASSLNLYNIIHNQPNADSVASVFWESMVAAMLLRGNAFAEKLMIGNRLVGLMFLNPCYLTLQSDINGNVKYLYTEKGKQREIPEARIFHIPGFSTNGKWGLSVVQYGAGVFGSALAADTAANSTWEKGLSPTIAYKIDRVIKKEQRDDFRDSMAEVSGAINAGKAVVLEGGMDAMPLGINPKDAQLLESRAFSVEEICRWFRVPPHMVGHSEKSTSWGTGIEQQMIGFLQFTLRPWLTRIEQHINSDLLTPVEQMRYYAEFNIEGLLRGDSAARSQLYASALQNGWMNRDIVADKENLPKIPGGDIYTVQSNLIPLDQLGKVEPSQSGELTNAVRTALEGPMRETILHAFAETARQQENSK